jgi:hypothetical protein
LDVSGMMTHLVASGGSLRDKSRETGRARFMVESRRC